MYGKLYPECSVNNFGASVIQNCVLFFFCLSVCLSVVWLLCYRTQLYANSSTHGREYQAVCYVAVWYIDTNISEDPTASVFRL